MWPVVLAAPFAGALLGAVARLWMRLITDDPEFTWNGTLFIVLAFALAMTGHALAWAVRQRGARRRWTTLARIVGGLLTMPLFGGAGAVMLPTVAAASLAVWRRDWPRPARVIAAAVAVPIPLWLVGETISAGVTLRRMVGLALMVATYVIVVRTMEAVVAPIPDQWRQPRWLRFTLYVLGGLTVLAAASLVVGVFTATE